MKILIPALLCLSLFSACIPDEPDPRIIPEPCITKTEITAPEGFEIWDMTTIDFEGWFDEFQFVSNEVGYVLGSKQVGSYAAVFKTMNGGQSWERLPLDINKHHWNMLFVDENVGFITLSDNAGCPDNCLHRTFLLKTTDGGQNWEEAEIPNLKGIISRLQVDDNGNLYGNLFLDQGSTIIKSIDKGATWDTLFHSPDLHIQLTTFSLELAGSKLYVPALDHKIIVLDTIGNHLQTLDPQQRSIWDVQIIDEQNLILTGDLPLISIDGGNNWRTMNQDRSRILHFFSPQRGLMIQTVDACPTDVVTLDDVITYTDNAGSSWTHKTPTTNLSQYFLSSQVLDNSRLLVLLRDKLIEIK